MNLRVPFFLATLALSLTLSPCPSASSPPASPAEPLVIGDTFTVPSQVLDEVRRINVFLPPGYIEAADLRFPVLYMADGGIAEDFLHIAGLAHISALNGTMRPFVLVGVENTQRRRDLTGPTEDPEDRKIAPVVGGSAAFRRFLRDELRPAVDARYRTSGETAIIGESLAGLFVVETFFLEPDLFEVYIAVDPSLWWNHEALLRSATDRLRAATADGRQPAPKSLFLAHSDQKEIARETWELSEILDAHAAASLTWHYLPLPEEKHGSVFHPAAIRAFRTVFAPPAETPPTAP